MPQLNKTSPGDNLVGKASSSKAIARDRKGRRTAFIIASIVIVLILTIVGVSVYLNTAPFRRTIITVDDTSINMDYFLKRTKLANADPMVMLEVLTNEQLIKIGAPRYVAEVSPEDVDQELRRIASGKSKTISESEFKEWYRQLLNEIGLSNSEYKEFVATNLLATRFHEYLAERVPTVAEQIYLHAILLDTEDMEKIWKKVDEGEDLNKLATEIWQDKQSEGKVEYSGWLPRGVLGPGFDQVAFNLTIGDVSAPLLVGELSQTEESDYFIIMVSEKADAREVDEDSLQVLKAKVLDAWLLEEIKFHEIGWHGLKNGFNSETYAWINWQLTKE
jgi:parvulin-like peptidyl-prolyl isomerase